MQFDRSKFDKPWYEILSEASRIDASIPAIREDSASDDCKKAYRKLALKYHPDRNPGDEVAELMFKKVTSAYNIVEENLRNEFSTWWNSVRQQEIEKQKAAADCGVILSGMNKTLDIDW